MLTYADVICEDTAGKERDAARQQVEALTHEVDSMRAQVAGFAVLEYHTFRFVVLSAANRMRAQALEASLVVSNLRYISVSVYADVV